MAKPVHIKAAEVKWLKVTNNDRVEMVISFATKEVKLDRLVPYVNNVCEMTFLGPAQQDLLDDDSK